MNYRKKFKLTNKQKLALLCETSNVWTTTDIVKYFDVCYPIALKIKQKVIKEYGSLGSNTKVSKIDVLKSMNLDLEQEIKNLKISMGVAR